MQLKQRALQVLKTNKNINIMSGQEVESYIINTLNCEPRHDVYALAQAVNQTREDMDYDNEWDLLYLLLENKPIPELHTHSYGFHTANGRGIIERITSYYHDQIRSRTS